MPSFSDFRMEAATLSAPSYANATEEYRGCRTWNVDDLAVEAAPHGFRVADTGEVASAHRFSEDIMGMRLAPLWSLASAHAHTCGSAWVHRERTGAGEADDISGVFLLLPLNWQGEAALRMRRFNYALPRLDELCAPGDEVASIYFWFCAGGDAAARRNLMRTTQAWLDGACAGLRIYGRAASQEGVRALGRFCFRRLAPDRADLFIHD